MYNNNNKQYLLDGLLWPSPSTTNKKKQQTNHLLIQQTIHTKPQEHRIKNLKQSKGTIRNNFKCKPWLLLLSTRTTIIITKPRQHVLLLPSLLEEELKHTENSPSNVVYIKHTHIPSTQLIGGFDYNLYVCVFLFFCFL